MTAATLRLPALVPIPKLPVLGQSKRMHFSFETSTSCVLRLTIGCIPVGPCLSAYLMHQLVVHDDRGTAKYVLMFFIYARPCVSATSNVIILSTRGSPSIARRRHSRMPFPRPRVDKFT